MEEREQQSRDDLQAAKERLEKETKKRKLEAEVELTQEEAKRRAVVQEMVQNVSAGETSLVSVVKTLQEYQGMRFCVCFCVLI